MAGFEKRMHVRKHFEFSIDFVVQHKIRNAPRDRVVRIHDLEGHLDIVWKSDSRDDKIAWRISTDSLPAGVAELGDARDLKSSRKKNGLFPLSPAVPATY
jgi:hypothetical protein